MCQLLLGTHARRGESSSTLYDDKIEPIIMPRKLKGSHRGPWTATYYTSCTAWSADMDHRWNNLPFGIL